MYFIHSCEKREETHLITWRKMKFLKPPGVSEKLHRTKSILRFTCQVLSTYFKLYYNTTKNNLSTYLTTIKARISKLCKCEISKDIYLFWDIQINGFSEKIILYFAENWAHFVVKGWCQFNVSEMPVCSLMSLCCQFWLADCVSATNTTYYPQPNTHSTSN